MTVVQLGISTFLFRQADTHDQLVQLLDALSRRIVRILERRGLFVADPVDPYLEFEVGSSLDSYSTLSIRARDAA